MHANLSPATLGMRGLDGSALIELAAAHGFGSVDLPLEQVRDVAHARDLGAEAAAAGVGWGLFWLPADALAVDDAGFADMLAALGRLLPLVEAAGCTRTYCHIWPASDEREPDANRAWHRARLRRMLPLLADHGVDLGLEFLGPADLRAGRRHPFLWTLPQLTALIDGLDPAPGVVLDCFHWYCSGGTLAEVRAQLRGRLVVNVHANDARPGLAPAQQRDQERALPLATGMIDAVGLLAELHALGYAGPVIAEPFQPELARLAAMAPAAVAAEIGALLARLIAEAKRRSRS